MTLTLFRDGYKLCLACSVYVGAISLMVKKSHMYLETSRHHMSLMQVSSAGRLFGVCPGRDKAGYACRTLGLNAVWLRCRYLPDFAEMIGVLVDVSVHPVWPVRVDGVRPVRPKPLHDKRHTLAIILWRRNQFGAGQVLPTARTVGLDPSRFDTLTLVSEQVLTNFITTARRRQVPSTNLKDRPTYGRFADVDGSRTGEPIQENGQWIVKGRHACFLHAELRHSEACAEPGALISLPIKSAADVSSASSVGFLSPTGKLQSNAESRP
ncbi:hypothetical protein IF2G_04698 [Cordyceps javanica]|nr:hypothetical protein IF2G_04698 [Cordyceps javanica]